MNAESLYALGLDQIANLIAVGGHQRTVLVQGHMGSGKSSLLKTLASRFPDHVPCYFDCTTKDVGDLALPSLQVMEQDGYVRFIPNEELGMHLNKPVILMIDEYGKGTTGVKNGMLRIMQERNAFGQDMHPDSIIFATTNLGAEGVGDILLPHARNRITVVRSRKASNIEFIEWGVNNDLDHTLLGACKDFPQWFQSFEEVQNPDDNETIYHPKAVGRTSFVTLRSLHAASDWLKQREFMDDDTLTAVLIGTIGNRAALDLMAYVKLSDQLPSLESIKRDPLTAKVPTSDAAVCMIVYRTLSTIERDWVGAWMEYLQRLDKEAQGLFAKNVSSVKYAKQSMVMSHAAFREWALKNNYMFSADI